MNADTFWYGIAGVCALLGVFGTFTGVVFKAGQRLQRIESQVANTHDTNLRDDLDKVIDHLEKQDETMQKMVERQAGTEANVANLTGWVGRLTDKVDKL